jgi:hypothetical protein
VQGRFDAAALQKLADVLGGLTGLGPVRLMDQGNMRHLVLRPTVLKFGPAVRVIESVNICNTG